YRGRAGWEGSGRLAPRGSEGEGEVMSTIGREGPAPHAGKVAIVTGGAKGIGGVISEHLAQDGADVVLVGRDADAIQAHAAMLDEKYAERRSLAIACDVTREEQVRA